jgi:uncharacterized membrane protein YcaP (DUF421 family)
VELVLRAAIVFFFLWMITRLVGRASLSEITTFELLIYVTMGDLIQQAVTQQDYSLTSAGLTVGIFALLTIGLSYVSWRFPRLRPWIRGKPVFVIRSGEPVLDVMRRQRLTMDDLMASAREQGLASIVNVRYAVLETDGKISFLTSSDSSDSDGAPEKSEASE